MDATHPQSPPSNAAPFLDASTLNFDGLDAFWGVGELVAAERRASEKAVAARAQIAAFADALPQTIKSLPANMGGLLRLGQSSILAAARRACGPQGMLAVSAVAAAVAGSAVQSGMEWSIKDQLRERFASQNHENAQSEALRPQPDPFIWLNSSRVPGWARAGLKAISPKAGAKAPLWPKLLRLPVAVDDKNPMSAKDLAAALLPKDPFLAMATQVEKPSTTPYFDRAGANIGMGYCIPERVAAYGEAHVRNDFAMAGIAQATINQLLSPKREEVMKAEITQSQALRLLMITKEDYVQRAKRVVGAEVFDSLSLERQSALAYLSYNSNMTGFTRLPQAIAAGRETEAMREMTPSFRPEKGAKLQRNYRLASYLWAAWTGHLGRALSDPAEHERLYAHDRGLAALVKDNKAAPKDPGVSAPLARVALNIQQQAGPPAWAAKSDPLHQTAAQVARDLAFRGPVKAVAAPAPINAAGKASGAVLARAAAPAAKIQAKLNPSGVLERRAAKTAPPAQSGHSHAAAHSAEKPKKARSAKA